MKRPIGMTIIGVMYFLGAAGYSAMLLLWLFSRDTLINLVEKVSPTASLAPALLLQMAGVVSLYFLLMACFCGIAGNGIWRLQAWSWFVTIAFVCISLVFDATLLLRVRRHLPAHCARIGSSSTAVPQLDWCGIWAGQAHAPRSDSAGLGQERHKKTPALSAGVRECENRTDLR